tara:strand:- start:5601 stop:6275 length:675 start_codon:yes stop_codon:yes gene_type:complete
MSFTFSSLKQAIQDYTQNTETSFVTNLPLFIEAAEERILKNVQLTFFRKNVSANTTAGSKYLVTPSDFLAPFSLSYTNSDNDVVFLDYKDVNYVQEYNPDETITGNPKYYSLFEGNGPAGVSGYFILAPTPASNLAVELHYFYRPNSLTAGAESDSTWLSTNAKIAMLYGSLIEAYTYMKGEADIMANYEKRFAEAIATLKNFGEAKEITDAYREGLVRRVAQS